MRGFCSNVICHRRLQVSEMERNSIDFLLNILSLKRTEKVKSNGVGLIKHSVNYGWNVVHSHPSIFFR